MMTAIISRVREHNKVTLLCFSSVASLPLSPYSPVPFTCNADHTLYLLTLLIVVSSLYKAGGNIVRENASCVVVIVVVIVTVMSL